MARTVTSLIVDAYYLSGVVSEGLQTVSGSQLHKGLKLLNGFLSIKSVNERLIPYFTSYEFNGIIGQEKYFIPGLISVETLTFNYSTVRWSMVQTTRVKYQGSSRPEGINSLMQEYYVERCLGGANIFMYFFPDMDYPLTIWGKFSLSSAVLNQDLSKSLDDFYLEYLKYGLASYICQDQNITFQPQNRAQLDQMEQVFLDISVPDLSVKKISGLSRRGNSIWGQVNLGHGWTTDSY